MGELFTIGVPVPCRHCTALSSEGPLLPESVAATTVVLDAGDVEVLDAQAQAQGYGRDNYRKLQFSIETFRLLQ